MPPPRDGAGARAAPSRPAPAKQPAVADIQSNLDPTAAAGDFYAKILAKVRPASEAPHNLDSKAMPSARKTLPPPTWGAISQPAPAAPVAEALVHVAALPAATPALHDIDIPIETELEPPAAPVSGSAPSPESRRASPVAPAKRIEPAVPVNIQLPPIAGTAEHRAIGSAAALAQGATVVIAPSVPPPAAAPAQSVSTVKPVTVSKPAEEVFADSTSPGLRAHAQRKSRRTAGTVIGVVSLLLLGVGGGVAATAYTLKSSNKDANAAAPASHVQAAAASTASAEAHVADNAQAGQAQTPPGTAPVGIDELGGKRANDNPLARAPSVKRTVHAGGSEPGPSSAGKAVAAAPEKPAKSGGAQFNRDAALAILGLAASQAPSCKRPGGPTGSGKALVTFDSDGSVIIANVVGGEIAGTPVARCVAGLFQRVKVAPFSGDRQTVSKAFTIPP